MSNIERSLVDLFTEAVAQGMHAPFSLNCEYWGRKYAEKAGEIVDATATEAVEEVERLRTALRDLKALMPAIQTNARGVIERVDQELAPPTVGQ